MILLLAGCNSLIGIGGDYRVIDGSPGTDGPIDSATDGPVLPIDFTKADFTTGPEPISVAVDDINSDGKLDLVVVNSGSSNISVLLNTTASGSMTASFASHVTFTTGSSPASVAIGDINGDGKPDAVVANLGLSSVSVLLNTTTAGAATPTFATKVDFTTGTGPVSVVLADFNGDGKPDIAASNNGQGSTVSVLLNTTTTGASTPTFATKVDFTTASIPNGLAAGDVNSDGKPDLVVGASTVVSVLLNTTATNATMPSFASKVDFFTGTAAVFTALGDLNGDLKPDVATVRPSSLALSVLVNTTANAAATPSFSPKSDLQIASSSSLAICDLDLAGSLDIVVANQSSASVSVLLNTTATGATTSTFAPKVDFATGLTPMSVAVGYINGDGKLDVVVANKGANTVSVLIAK